jgi:glycosyltransferase involved in cell wall biosynthesis
MNTQEAGKHQPLGGATPVISVVVPVTNESASIQATLRDMEKIFDPAVTEYLVVVNGCQDGSDRIVRDFLVTSRSQVRVLEFPNLLGKGKAILRGFAAAQGRILGFVDADGTTDLYVVGRLADQVDRDECDCAIASKWKDKPFVEVMGYSSLLKKVLSRGLNIATRTLFRMPFSDTQCGAKFLKRSVWDRIGSDFLCQGFDFDVELLLRIQSCGFRVSETALSCRRAPSSSFRMRDLAPMALNLSRLWWRRRVRPAPGAAR